MSVWSQGFPLHAQQQWAADRRRALSSVALQHAAKYFTHEEFIELERGLSGRVDIRLYSGGLVLTRTPRAGGFESV